MSLSQIHVPPTIIHTNEKGIKTAYIRNEELGHGGFAVVHRVTQQNTNQSYAMKVISKERYSSSKGKLSLEKLKNEMQIQRSLNHQNIVKSRISFSDQFNYYIVLEYCPGKSVREYLRKSDHGRLSEPETRRILNDVIKGLVYLHNRQIIHHDLKLENFLIGSDGKVKIADFGLSTIINEFNDDDDDNDEKENKKSICGTPNYLSPEILRKEKNINEYKCDVWALGIAAYIMLTGRPPFEGINKENTYEKIKKCDFQFPSRIPLSNEAKDFIKTILRMDASKRPTVIDLINHPFLLKYDNDQVQLYKSSEKVQIPIVPSQKVQNNYSKIVPIQNNHHVLPRKLASSLNSNQYANSKIMTIQAPVRSRSTFYCAGIKSSNININNNASAKITDELNSSYKKSSINLNPIENCHVNSINQCPLKKGFDIPSFFVARHCFYNNEMGYLLGNGTVGVCFEDTSRIVLDPNEEFVQYYKNYNSFPEVINLDDFIELNDDIGKIQKKISLVQKFAKIFKKSRNLFELERINYDSSIPLHNVKYFAKNGDSILFKLNDKNIQANFADHKKMIVFWKNKKLCLFRSMKEKCNLMNINDVVMMNSNCEEFRKYKNIR